ncbi:MAG: SMC family ATPase [Anaerolineae bacterium]|nr:SMC family ATPase [Anaerolineae bacterium]
MIPEVLHLRNFLSHRETELDLRGIHLASLVGENGAGKSALLDAITWAVWGKSRAAYGHEEDLIYHGENEILVEFVFRMPYQGGPELRYRILRGRELQGRRSTGSVLDFQVEGEGGWRALNGNTMRETQSRIVAQIGLDYDTFVNSAYLRQGHADEFTVQTPADRKRVLSAILGLDRWAIYQDHAKKRLATAQGRMEETDRRLKEIEAELAQRAQIEVTLKNAQLAAGDAASRLETAQQEVNALTRKQEQAASLRHQIQERIQRLSQEQERLAQLAVRAEAHRQRRDTYTATIAREKDIEQRYRAYQTALAEERAWVEKLGEAARLQQQRSRYEQAISAAREALRAESGDLQKRVAGCEQAIVKARNQIEGQWRDLQGEIRALEERISTEAVVVALEDVEGQLAYLEQLVQTLDHSRADLHQAEVERQRLLERNRQLREKMDETKTNLDTLSQAAAVCPLCRQPLTPEHQAQMLAQIETEGKAMGDEYRANKQEIKRLETQEVSLEEQMRQHERTLRERPKIEQQVARLKQQLEFGEEAERRVGLLRQKAYVLKEQLDTQAYGAPERDLMTQLQAEITQRERLLEGGEFALEARAGLQEVTKALEELGYDVAAHNALKQQIRDLATAEADFRDLEKARVGVLAEEETLLRLVQEQAAQEKQVAAVRSATQSLEAQFAALQPELARLPLALQALQNARHEEVSAQQRVATARQMLATLDTQEQRLARLRDERLSLIRRVGLLKELRDAFGVNGIPAMIIEHTIPELERETNRILEQLTGGRMHIRFETQRETKSGAMRETLDIIISDEKGTRPYENFSGGEQFRVNFAIRVALSRLLAQRAGVRLRSLFVDEGFGALDADGRRRLVEAVKAVQGDFDLVLVITHIDELKDAFPVHIQVTKTGAGSLIEVI